ncbi:MAG: hypothetical protein CO135_01460 [Candidatus Levybacteria bacterium CG_4_9_14_3_um_filter_35_16]|nr:MAG: hypothetical protein COW87_02635 [Candidatus Levybacteria bacterium CG22_combo_CG10-13_8_21_14_all_35_11]PJA91445.1 MAG: hypothetical protein CO135_01460 [Candidatus Levybacteria bacterium CG_4_9_14_3_um_filter_35_16]PJC54517.1 MAG: hypothetical protein CO028_01975 [Candidatus Levybacteria bacterium CG_4_9_14_0_2_um_filter_35_21]
MEYLRKLKKNYYFWLLLTLLLAAFLRFYQLGNIPSGFLNDEANKGYDVYSLLATGKDQWVSFLPLINLRGFGDYPPLVYHYLSIIPVLLFGLNEFSIRFISAIAGISSVFLIYLLGKKIFNEKVGVFSALSLAIFPWAIGLSRVAMEANIAITLFLGALIFGLKNRETKRIRNLIISTFFLALTIYTYSAFILFAPIVFIVIIIDNSYKNKIKLKKVLIPLLIFLLLITPIFIKKNSGSVRFSQVGLRTNINSIGFINTLNMQRGQCIKIFPSTMCKVFENKVVLYSSALIKNYFSHFSSNFLYVSGTTTQFPILEKRGLDYIFNAIFLLIGFYFLLKINKEPRCALLAIGFLLLSPLADSLTGDGNYTRASTMIPFLALINGIGMSYSVTLLNKIKSRYLSILIYFVSVSIITFSVFTFFVSYLTYFKNDYSIYSQYGYKDLIRNIYSNKFNYDRIYLSSNLNDSKQYIYYLFYTKYDPAKYQQKKDVDYSTDQDGWISIDRIENIYFVPSFSKTLFSAKDPDNNLLISNPVDFPKDIKSEFEVKDKLGNVIFKAVRLRDLVEYNRRVIQ